MKKYLSLTMVFALLLSACAPKEPAQNGDAEADTPAVVNRDINFMLDWAPNTNHTGVYVAQALGYYEEAGLKVNIIQPAEDDSITAVAAGQAEFGVSFQENLGVALAQEHPMPVTAVATIINHNTSGLISLQDKGIETFKDLEGKRYATWGLDIEQAILKFAVESEGGDFSKVEMIPNTATDAISLLESGTADAVWVYETWDNVRADLDEVIYNYVPFAQASPVLDFYTPIIVANSDFLTNESDAATAFMHATAKGYQYAIEHPQEAAAILLEAVPELDKDMVELSQEILAGYYQAESEYWGYIDEVRWAMFYDFLYAQGLIDKELSISGFTNAFLPQ